LRRHGGTVPVLGGPVEGGDVRLPPINGHAGEAALLGARDASLTPEPTQNKEIQRG
jgi:hypothetical protein